MSFCGQLHVLGAVTLYKAEGIRQAAPPLLFVVDDRCDLVDLEHRGRHLVVYTARSEPRLEYDLPISGKRWLFAQHYSPEARNAILSRIAPEFLDDASHLLRKTWWQNDATHPMYIKVQHLKENTVQPTTVFLCEHFFAVWVCCARCAGVIFDRLAAFLLDF